MIKLIEPDSVYMIRHKDLRPFFFLYDCIDTDYLNLDTVLWTRIQYKAREFYSKSLLKHICTRNSAVDLVKSYWSSK